MSAKLAAGVVLGLIVTAIAFVVEAKPEEIGRAALDGQVVLTHLGPSEGAGLEQVFFDLTETPA